MLLGKVQAVPDPDPLPCSKVNEWCFIDWSSSRKEGLYIPDDTNPCCQNENNVYTRNPDPDAAFKYLRQRTAVECKGDSKYKQCTVVAYTSNCHDDQGNCEGEKEVQRKRKKDTAIVHR